MLDCELCNDSSMNYAILGWPHIWPKDDEGVICKARASKYGQHVHVVLVDVYIQV